MAPLRGLPLQYSNPGRQWEQRLENCCSLTDNSNTWVTEAGRKAFHFLLEFRYILVSGHAIFEIF